MKLLARVRHALRARHYSPRTEHAYVRWILRYLRFHGRRHPGELGSAEVTAFLANLTARERLSPSTQNQALAALLFLYGAVLGQRVGWLAELVRTERPRRLPVALTRDEVRTVLNRIGGVERLVAGMLYGSGLRLAEGLALRVTDLDFARREVVVRGRRTILAEAQVLPLRRHLERVRGLHERDVAAGVASWPWVFPAGRTQVDPASGERRRHHLHPSVVQRAFHAALQVSGVSQPASCHTLRHSFATHLLDAGYDVRTVQALLGHRDVRTTMIYAQVLKRAAPGVRSPADGL
jgi:site-specific recombinase XerD